MAVNARVEARKMSGHYDRVKLVTSMLRALKRMCNEVGVMHDYKEHEAFIRKCDIRRRKRQRRARAPMEAELKAKEELQEKKKDKSKRKGD